VSTVIRHASLGAPHSHRARSGAVLEGLVDLARGWSVRLLALLAGLAFWYWAAEAKLDLYIRFENVPSPVDVAAAFARHLGEGSFYVHILVSIRRILIGYLLAGEIISGQYGIGYFTWNAYSLIDYEDIVVGMLTIGALGTLSTYAVRLLTRPLLAWQQRAR
jgi:ABC-type nitrate/sulfonate/bicarbonate transport system permease component